ncbi:hypothetical protein AAU57_08845 [Nonlabens sp. YIK11]|uniref:Clp protease ClpP n=1 Tax=Nonlabens sp. YIK11 TaxID=1453349 RepID=UPI0006DD26ED|nr:Clp protease ClpP [Nonlabens sp. YIK11]KQC33410.1 hypothetical protein AAU57_08845 [Nonlabens sp. YIK11]
MKGTIYISGVIGEDVTLIDVIRQIKALEDAASIDVIIDSVGGSVEVGMAIFNYLDKLDKPVNTIAKQAYSIAASIFMVGEERIVEEGADVLMIHLPWVDGFSGNSYQLEGVVKELQAIENDLVNFYTNYINIDEKTIKNLLDNDTFLSADEAVELGFATSIKQSLKAVAFYDNKSKQETKKMSKTKKFINALNEFFSDKVDATIQNLILQDANGDDVNFTELDADEVPQVGDKAVDGDGKVIDGERVATDGSKWVFEAGVLTEVDAPEEDSEEEIEVDAEAKVEEETEVKAEQEVKEISKWSMTINEDNPQEGDVLTYSYDEDTYTLGAGEFELANGNTAITDADGIVVKLIVADAPSEDEAEPSTEEVEEDAAVTAMVAMLSALKADNESFKQENENFKKEILALKKSIGSEEATVNARTVNNNTKQSIADLPKNLQALAALRK